MRLSLICCYNKKELFKSLNEDVIKQTEKVKLIGIDNSNNLYSSASKAYNAALKKVKTKYVVFLHQDIAFFDTGTLEKFVDYLETIDEDDILGVAGSVVDSNFLYTNIFVEKVGVYGGSRRVEGIKKCDTLDECFFGGTKEHFEKYNFDEVLCDGWHLYAVERCLDTLSQGGNVYVCDVSFLHLSPGYVDSNFNITFRELCKRYHNCFKCIRTPCAFSGTNILQRNLWYIKKQIRNCIWMKK